MPDRDPLGELVEALDAACAGPMEAMPRSIAAALAAAVRRPGLLMAAQRLAAEDRYARHLLHADAQGRYSLVSLVWRPGQFSPVHAHYTWCGYAVLEGDLHETRYRVGAEPADEPRQLDMAQRRVGEARFSHAGMEDAHRLGNAGRANAISIHAYGIDAPRVATHVNRLFRRAVA